MEWLNAHVVRKGTISPVGIVEEINDDLTVRVRWGTMDKKVYREDIPANDLSVIVEKIFSAEEIQKRQAEASGVPYREVD
jgi:hypothetical protein